MIKWKAMHPQIKAFLDMIARSELGEELLDLSDDGYNVIVCSTPSRPILFHDYSDHHRRLITPRRGMKPSSAAGRYQILARNYDAYKQPLRLRNFGPDAQDRIAIKLITECDATDDIIHGDIKAAIAKCASRWASFPGAGYGQHEHKIAPLIAAFKAAGGVVV